MAGLSSWRLLGLYIALKKAQSTQTQKLVVNYMLPVAHLERTWVILDVAIRGNWAQCSTEFERGLPLRQTLSPNF